MKNYILLFLSFAVSSSLIAQDKAVAKIHYLFKHVNDTNKRDIPLKDDVVSYLGHESYYYTTLSDQRMKKEIEVQKALSGFDGHLTLVINSSPIMKHYIINPGAKKTQNIQCISSGFDAYQLDGTYQSLDWDIEEDEKQIGDYLCQKATTSFAGRHYTAWFTTELPFSFGPWKLHGLPGLILEAHDDKNEVSFEYAGFDKLTESQPIVAPSYVLPCSRDELKRLQKAFKDNTEAYYSTLQSSGRMNTFNQFYGIDYNTMYIDFDSAGYQPSTETNNPMELTND